MNGLNPLDGDDFLEEDEEYEEDNGIPAKVPKATATAADVHAVEQGLKNTNLNQAAQARAPQQQQKGYGQHSAAVTAAAKQQVRNRKGAFELNLEGATLLGRRGQKGPSGLRETAVAQ